MDLTGIIKLTSKEQGCKLWLEFKQHVEDENKIISEKQDEVMERRNAVEKEEVLTVEEGMSKEAIEEIAQKNMANEKAYDEKRAEIYKEYLEVGQIIDRNHVTFDDWLAERPDELTK